MAGAGPRAVGLSGRSRRPRRSRAIGRMPATTTGLSIRGRDPGSPAPRIVTVASFTEKVCRPPAQRLTVCKTPGGIKRTYAAPTVSGGCRGPPRSQSGARAPVGTQRWGRSGGPRRPRAPQTREGAGQPLGVPRRRRGTTCPRLFVFPCRGVSVYQSLYAALESSGLGLEAAGPRRRASRNICSREEERVRPGPLASGPRVSTRLTGLLPDWRPGRTAARVHVRPPGPAPAAPAAANCPSAHRARPAGSQGGAASSAFSGFRLPASARSRD